MKLLIDECLHTSLVELAHAAGHVAHHVNYLGLGSSKDWQLMATIRVQDYTFVTNNRSAKSPTVSAQGVLCECVRVPTSPNLQGGLRGLALTGICRVARTKNRR